MRPNNSLNLNKMTLEEVKKLSFRKFDKVTTYNSIAIAPSGKMHDSGWGMMYIIGMDAFVKPIEIAATCDVIWWALPSVMDRPLQTDMFESGVVHFYSKNYQFEVGESLCSTDIRVYRKNESNK